MEWMLMPYRRYADFSGRSRRLEYWMFALFQFIVSIVFFGLMLADAAQTDANGYGTREPGMLFYLAIVGLVFFALVTFIPSLAVLVRRLHDSDKSGWWILIQLIPFGGLVLLVFTLLEGTPGENSYGPDPKADFSETFR